MATAAGSPDPGQIETGNQARYGRRGMLRDFVILLSVVNFAYVRVWGALLTLRRTDRFWMAREPGRSDYLSPIIGILLITAILWSFAVWVRMRTGRLGHRLARAVFLVLVIVPMLQVRNVLSSFYPNEMGFMVGLALSLLKPWPVRIALLAASIPIGVRLFNARWRFPRALAVVFVCLSPFVVITFSQAIVRIVQYRPSRIPPDGHAPYLASAGASPRVLWVIWDEWDYRLTFRQRDATLSLPEIDRFRDSSFAANNAYPPGIGTLTSIPSLIDGRIIDAAQGLDWGTAYVRYARTKETLVWGTEPTVFSKARAAGFNTAVAGTYFPYCRTLASSLSSCFWLPMETPFNSTGHTIPEKVVNQARSLFETNLLSLFGQSLPTRQRVKTYFAMMDQIRAIVADRRNALMFIHFPLPHSPHTYDRRRGAFTLGNKPFSGYIDSLALLDRSIGELRAFLEQCAESERPIVIFTSDHAYRSALSIDGKMDARVPFLVKFPGQSGGVVYKPQFNTISTSDIVLAMLRREIGSAAALAAWLDAHRNTTIVPIGSSAVASD